MSTLGCCRSARCLALVIAVVASAGFDAGGASASKLFQGTGLPLPDSSTVTQQLKSGLNLEIPLEKVPIEEHDEYFEPIPYALSTTYLTHLARNEELLYESVLNYKADLEERLRLINQYTSDYEATAIAGTEAQLRAKGSEDPWDRARLIAAHPLNAYRMVRRFTKEFVQMAKHIWDMGLEPELGRVVSSLAGRSGWPREDAHSDTIEALLRLHHVYNFKLSDFADGKFFGASTSTSSSATVKPIGLTTAQMYEIAEYAMTHDYFTLAMDWLQVTEEKILAESNSGSNSTTMSEDQWPNLVTIRNAKWRNQVKHDRDYHWYLTSKNHYMYTDKINDTSSIGNLTSLRDHKYATVVLQHQPSPERGSVHVHELHQKVNETHAHTMLDGADSEYYNYLALCNGENFQPEAVRSSLYCWYERNANPYFYINPLKAELLNYEPYLVQIYEFISDRWIQDLQIASLPTLKRAPSSSFKQTTPRTAAYAWLMDEDIPHVPLSRRIEFTTGLVVRGDAASTPLQIASYAFGGHVNTHYDSLNELDPFDNTVAEKGNRVATFLIYLNDVQVGGLTAFPVLGTFVKPVKGSAVLWYTARPNCKRDDRMLHGACPTIVGQKWIATKWVHLHQNFLTRPCSLVDE